jgi:pimeloyl-ACP methyl ester carboxylesterase
MTLTSESHTIRVNEVELAWAERGRSEAGAAPLVLVHGFTGSSHDWALEVDSLAERRRVVTLDHRGHGFSTKLGSLDGYSIPLLAADLTQFVEAVGDGPVDLLGHSMGGRVVLRLVLERPDLVRSLILMDTSAWSFQPTDEAIRSMVNDFIARFEPAAGMPATLNLGGPEDKLIEATTPPEWQKEKDAIFAGMDPYAFKALGTELGADAAEGPGSVRSRLSSVTCPTTVIAGEHDHPLVDQAAALAAELGDGRLVVIEGAYHSPQLTPAEAWRAAVEAHLQWVDASRGSGR